MVVIDRCVRITFSEFLISASRGHARRYPHQISLSGVVIPKRVHLILLSLQITLGELVADVEPEHTEIVRSNGYVFHSPGASMPTSITLLATDRARLSLFPSKDFDHGS